MTFINIPKVVCLSLIQLSFANPVRYTNNGCQHPCTSEGICKSMQFSDNCYYVFTNTMTTWQESGELCESYDMKMVQFLKNVTSQELKREVLDLLKDLESGSYVWLGGKARDLEDWTFLNGIGVNETNANFPSSSEDGQQLHLCGVVLDDLTVDKEDCRNMHPFICRFDDWQNMPNFYISEARTNWYEARSKCKDLNGDLLYLKSGESLRFLNRKLQPFKDQRFFIGLTTRLWEWKDDQEIVHYNWQDKEPNKLSEKCIVMYPSTAQWNDMDCNAKLFPFCQQGRSINGDKETVTQSQPHECSNTGLTAGIVILTIIVIIALLAVVFLIFRKKECFFLCPKSEQKSKHGKSNKKSPYQGSGHTLLAQEDPMESQSRRKSNKKSEHGKSSKKSQYQRSGTQEDPNQNTGWPFHVELQDAGNFCKIFLRLPGMQLFDNKKPTNVTVTNKKVFTKRTAEIYVAVAEDPNKEVKYHYKVSFQKDIDTDASMIKYQPEHIVLFIKKVEVNHSWEKYGYQPSNKDRPSS